MMFSASSSLGSTHSLLHNTMKQSAIFIYMYTKTKLISDKLYLPFFINFGSSKLI